MLRAPDALPLGALLPVARQTALAVTAGALLACHTRLGLKHAESGLLREVVLEAYSGGVLIWWVEHWAVAHLVMAPLYGGLAVAIN